MTDRHLGGHAALLAAYTVFGFNVPVMKSVLADGHITPVALAFFRLAGALVVFWLLSVFMPKEKVPLRDHIPLFFASLFGIFLCQFLFSIGLDMTSPIDAAIINTIGPVMTMLLAAFFLREPVTWKKTLGVLIGIAGALLLIFTNHGHDRNGSSLIGNLTVLLSTLAFVIYLTAFKNVVVRYRPVTLMKWLFFYATLCSLPFCLGSVCRLNFATIPLSVWISVLYVVLMATFLSYFLIPIGQKFLRPTIVSMYNYIQPVVASIVAVTTSMDTFGLDKTIATVLIFTGVYVVTQSKSRAQMDKTI
jgi:drug/metabolite transporter (DMT)-like permease